MRGGIERPVDLSCPLGDSYSPYCGRGGRSGVDLAFGSGRDTDRWRVSVIIGLFRDTGVRICVDTGAHSGVRGVA